MAHDRGVGHEKPVFLAYATTAAVARRVGAGDLQAAIRQGMDGIWLALLLGAAVVAVVIPTASGS
ncbi:hypothetical protein SVIOM74S_01578 [Streptomyces violarus]